jgi:hypothetical protein
MSVATDWRGSSLPPTTPTTTGVNENVENLSAASRPDVGDHRQPPQRPVRNVMETLIDRSQLRRLAEPTIFPTEGGYPASSWITRAKLH